MVKPFGKSALTSARVRQFRAVELLEAVGTPAARKLPTELAAGGSGAPLTLDASAALRRARSMSLTVVPVTSVIERVGVSQLVL